MKTTIEACCYGVYDEDVVKLVVLYFLHNGLLRANNKNVIQDQIIHIADNLDAFS